MTACARLALLACGSSGLTVAHLPALRAYVRRFAGVRGVRLIHGAGDRRKDDAPAAIGADKLWEVAFAVELPGFTTDDADRFPAYWRTQGRMAGPLRNEVMREAARGYARRGWTVRWVAAHTDPGLGKGTAGMVALCRAEGWRGRVLILSHDGQVVSEEAVS
ncbi:hypothetical protein JKA73_17435 [Myxococcus xanthus]|uniref:hypothetical protein n=1 Tax=Myxococcus xanthus TaxID=34 RepID=UPI0019177FA7|nr:hypothetical protein [Myxococcus xanthus]QQR47719.1 hypothetical protein JKA73_17435 [Myxococcus xanthus]